MDEIGHANFLALPLHKQCVAAVSVLPIHRDPAAVFGTVVPVHILPLNAQAILVPVAHGPIPKGVEVVPFLAILDPSPTVVVIELELGVIAPLVHGVEDVVELGAALSVGAVACAVVPRQAPAASGLSRP